MQNTESEAVLEDFIRRHGESVLGGLARGRLRELRAAAITPYLNMTSRAPSEEVRLAGGGNKCVVPGSGVSFRDCWEKGVQRICGPEMVVVPRGEFLLGSPQTEKERADDEDDKAGVGGKRVRVRINEPFAVGKFEVTVEDWEACLGDGGCKKKLDPTDGRGRQPARDVSWNVVVNEYLPWLTRNTGKIYRLLSEAEWEYAARAGTQTAYSWGSALSETSCNGCGKEILKGETLPVGSFAPNGWGLYDVHGNVWEWVQDCYTNSYANTPRDGRPRAGTANCRAVRRGGSYYSGSDNLRSAVRDEEQADVERFNLGFRIARELDP